MSKLRDRIEGLERVFNADQPVSCCRVRYGIRPPGLAGVDEVGGDVIIFYSGSAEARAAVLAELRAAEEAKPSPSPPPVPMPTEDELREREARELQTGQETAQHCPWRPYEGNGA